MLYKRWFAFCAELKWIPFRILHEHIFKFPSVLKVFQNLWCIKQGELNFWSSWWTREICLCLSSSTSDVIPIKQREKRSNERMKAIPSPTIKNKLWRKIVPFNFKHHEFSVLIFDLRPIKIMNEGIIPGSLVFLFHFPQNEDRGRPGDGGRKQICFEPPPCFLLIWANSSQEEVQFMTPISTLRSQNKFACSFMVWDLDCFLSEWIKTEVKELQ